MSSAYLGPRNKPGRLKTITFGLKLIIDKTLGASDKVILPEHVINEIMREFTNPPNPIIFEIHSITNYNKNKPPQLHCGVLQFTAERKTARIPYWMTYCLKNGRGERIKEGERMKFKLIRALEPATFAKFIPLDKRFARDIQTPRASLEHALRKFTVLTIGQRIPIIHDGKVYPLKIEMVRPSPAAHLIDTNLQVEFEAFDESKTVQHEEFEGDIQGLINGNVDENKSNIVEEDEYVEVELISAYSKIVGSVVGKRGVFYKVKIGNPNFGVRFVLEILSGDCNMYVHYDFDKPSVANHYWFDEYESKSKVINVCADDPKFTNWFFIGIHAFECMECKYEFVVDQDMTESYVKVDDKGNMLGSANDKKSDDTIADNMEKCANCGKLINKASFMMHSMRCSNINWKCDICAVVISKSMKNKHIHCKYHIKYNCNKIFVSESSLARHIVLRHTEIECNLCHLHLFPNQIQSHQNFECTFRKVCCSFCGMKLKYLEMEQHEKYCGSLTIECELCGETITRKWLQNHLASEHNINPTLQTNLVNTIIHSNLGLNQNMEWEEKKENNDNDIKGLDDEDGSADKELNDLEDLDPVVKDIQRQLSHTASLNDVTSPKVIGAVTSAQEKINEDEEEEYDDDVYDYQCPFCQKHPPKTQDFGEHLANCSEKQMNEDSD